MISAWLMSLALSTSLVPPYSATENHAHPAHYGQPTTPRFERRAVDRARREAWDAYCRELETLWADYRRNGSTPAAWEAYKQGVSQAKFQYLYNDPYLLPIID